MALPELDVARVQSCSAARVSERARHQIRVERHLAPRQLTIIECRAPRREAFGSEWTSIPIAGLRHTASEKSRTSYWRDRNLHFPLDDQMAPARHVAHLLNELDRDPTCSFCR